MTGDLGVAVLDDLRADLSRDEVARYLAEFGGGVRVDAATLRLHGVTAGHIDLSVEVHRLALIGWLRSWGVRHLRLAGTPQTAQAPGGSRGPWGARAPRAR